MRKTQNDELQLVILVLEARKKTLTFKVKALLNVSCPKLHKISKLQDLHKLHKVSTSSTTSPSSPSSPIP
jgi:hypothetical protein